MSLQCDYFRADSDETASATASWPGGPGRPPSPKRGRFRQASAEQALSLPSVEFPGVEPVVMLATLEEQLTGVAAEEALDANADAMIGSHKKTMIFRLRDELVHALAVAQDDRIREAAGPWSETDEFFGDADPEVLAEGLVHLAALAREAVAGGAHVYCWVSP